MRSVQRGKYPPGKETPVPPGELDALNADVVPARPWGGRIGVGFVELTGGLLGRCASDWCLVKGLLDCRPLYSTSTDELVCQYPSRSCVVFSSLSITSRIEAPSIAESCAVAAPTTRVKASITSSHRVN
jgi:hypothetical protein